MNNSYRLPKCEGCPKQDYCDGTIELYSGASIETDESLKPSLMLYGRIACSLEIDSSEVEASRQLYIGSAETYQDYKDRYNKTVKLLRVSQRQTYIASEAVLNY